jgi:hypothetical protein
VKTKGIIDAFWLKIFMAVLMLMDHLYYYIPGFPQWFHIVSRVVAPMFTYFVAEGMVHTSNRLKYLTRLYIVASIMLAAIFPFQFIFGAAPANSIIMSLAITASIIYCIDKARAKKPGWFTWIAAAFMLFVLSFFFEGAMTCPVMGIIFYYLRKNRIKMCVVYVVIMAALLWILNLFWDPQIFMLFAVVPILLYNGERGLSTTFSKDFFYIFYPLHIWILFIAQQLFFK